MNKKYNEQGYTLLELSIVVALIGLIIGAVIQGQAMIEISNLKTTAKQWEQTKTAIELFTDKYNALPGDYEAASGFIDPTCTDGDGDAIIEINNGSDNEMGNTWNHLELSGIMQNTNEDGLPGRMKAKVDDGEFWMVTDVSHNGINPKEEDGIMDNGWHYINLRKTSDMNVATALDSPNHRLQIVSSDQAHIIDMKYDDEDRSTGNIIYACVGNDYSIANKDRKNCYMQFLISKYY
jgi:prepilin-type N-terminal cleavage/methylation domain-containing protein